MKTKQLTFLLSLTLLFLFSSSSVVFGDSLQDGWEEKAKSLGIPMIPDAAVIMCEPESQTGFNWKNGTWVDAKFKERKRLFKKLPLTKNNCPYDNVEPEDNDLSKNLPKRKVCIATYLFGETPNKIGNVCEEYYTKYNGQWISQIVCAGKGLRNPKAAISPNGLYHLATLNFNLLPNPPDDYKDSQYIEWGKCATISP